MALVNAPDPTFYRNPEYPLLHRISPVRSGPPPAVPRRDGRTGSFQRTRTPPGNDHDGPHAHPTPAPAFGDDRPGWKPQATPTDHQPQNPSGLSRFRRTLTSPDRQCGMTHRARGTRHRPCQGTSSSGVECSTEDSPRGLGRTLGKRVGGNPSRVRISYPPPVPHRARCRRAPPLAVGPFDISRLPLSWFLSARDVPGAPQTASASCRTTSLSMGPCGYLARMRPEVPPRCRTHRTLGLSSSSAGCHRKVSRPPPAFGWCGSHSTTSTPMPRSRSRLCRYAGWAAWAAFRQGSDGDAQAIRLAQDVAEARRPHPRHHPHSCEIREARAARALPGHDRPAHHERPRSGRASRRAGHTAGGGPCPR